MRAFLMFTLGFFVWTAMLYTLQPASASGAFALQWFNLIIGYYVGAMAARRFRW